MSHENKGPEFKITPKENGVTINFSDFDLEITIKPTKRHQKDASPDSISVIESLKKDLSPYLKDVDIIEGEENLTVKPRRFLGRAFSPIADIIKYYGGSYVSEEKESRFIIPLDKTPKE